MEASIRTQGIDSYVQEGGVQILQVGIGVYEGPYGCPFWIQK